MGFCNTYNIGYFKRLWLSIICDILFWLVKGDGSDDNLESGWHHMKWENKHIIELSEIR